MNRKQAYLIHKKKEEQKALYIEQLVDDYFHKRIPLKDIQKIGGDVPIPTKGFSKDEMIEYIHLKYQLDHYKHVYNERIENLLTPHVSIVRYFEKPSKQKKIPVLTKAMKFVKCTETHFIVKPIIKARSSDLMLNKDKYMMFVKINEQFDHMQDIDNISFFNYLCQQNTFRIQTKDRNGKWSHCDWEDVIDYIDEHKDELYQHIQNDYEL